jgi:undecaprenyl-diphosphatase
MSGLEALLLGLLQGLTEFLPVSSSGHLVIAQVLLGADQEGLLFEIVVHVATLGSVLVFYRRRVASLSAGVLGRSPEALRYLGKLALATLPAVLVVSWAGELVERQFESARTAALCLLVTGGILWSTRRTLAGARLPEPGWSAALLIGCAQAVALLPGISRSGATVAAALALGVAPAAAAEFSFLMSVIAIAGAAVRSLPELAAAPPAHATALLLGAALALLSGIAAIWLFVRMLRAGAFHRFAYYTWSVGLLTLLWLASR